MAQLRLLCYRRRPRWHDNALAWQWPGVITDTGCGVRSEDTSSGSLWPEPEAGAGARRRAEWAGTRRRPGGGGQCQWGARPTKAYTNHPRRARAGRERDTRRERGELKLWARVVVAVVTRLSKTDWEEEEEESPPTRHTRSWPEPVWPSQPNVHHIICNTTKNFLQYLPATGN